MQGKTLNESAAELLRAGRSFALAVIVSQDGSTPRESGSKMLILPESIVGTIGGGSTEAAVMERGREDLRAGRAFRFVQFDMSGQNNSDAEPICGGSTEVLIARIDASDAMNLAVFEAAVKAEREGIPAWMYYIADENEGAACPFQLAVNVGGEITGKLHGAEKRLRYLMSSPLHAAIHGEKADGVRYIADEIGALSVMYLFGAGHVSMEVARLAVGLGFRTVVFDDRAEYANEQRFPGCEVVVLEDFRKIPNLPAGPNTYILIITRGHAHDRTVLRWALGKSAGYIGMIGSRTKREATYKSLEAEGFSMEKMRDVACPIGLSIGAKTPAEIAVSIMAEIIQVRSGGGKEEKT